MRIIEVLAQLGGWCLQETHVRGVENILVMADGRTRWKENEICSRITEECLAVTEQAHKLGVEGAEMCPEILRAATHLDELRSRFGGLMRKVQGG